MSSSKTGRSLHVRACNQVALSHRDGRTQCELGLKSVVQVHVRLSARNLAAYALKTIVANIMDPWVGCSTAGVVCWGVAAAIGGTCYYLGIPLSGHRALITFGNTGLS